MGDLSVDTAVQRTGPSTFAATLSPDWEIWGPNGGYLAAVALRAAGVQVARARPASISAHFVGAGASGPIELAVEVNRATKVATSATVRVHQDDRPLLMASVWGADDDLPGLEHHTDRRPVDVAGPDDLPSTTELLADPAAGPPHPFWQNVEHHPVHWIVDWEARTVASEAEAFGWYRFVPTPTFADPWVDAARSLILIDLDSWPAAMYAHVGELEHYAPTIELSARFMAPAGDEPWLLSRARVPVASGGLMAATGEIWNADRRLVAIGGSTLLCRPAIRRPDR